MKKRVIAILLGIGVLFFVSRSIISSNGKEYLNEIINGYNKIEDGNTVAKIVEFNNSYSLAKAKIAIKILGKDQKELLVKNPLKLPLTIKYGPLIGKRAGLAEIDFDEPLDRFLKAKFNKEFKKIVPNGVMLHYWSLLDWSHNIFEKFIISKISIKEPNNRWLLEVDPIVINSRSSLRSLVGKSNISSKIVSFKQLKDNYEVLFLNPKLSININEVPKDAPIFATSSISLPKIILNIQQISQDPLELSAWLKVALEHTSTNYTSFNINYNLKTLDETTSRFMNGFNSLSGSIKLQNLGLKGLREFIALQKKSYELQKELKLAIKANNDIKMQRLLLAIQALDSSWIRVYNNLLIPKKSRLIVNKQISMDKKSTIKLDLLYTGKPINSTNAISAMISLMSQADHLVEGNFDLVLEKKLAKMIYPNAKFILDSMVLNGLATCKEGFYYLKGSIKDGKIIINNKAYTPQELMLMIFI